MYLINYSVLCIIWCVILQSLSACVTSQLLVSNSLLSAECYQLIQRWVLNNSDQTLSVGLNATEIIYDHMSMHSVLCLSLNEKSTMVSNSVLGISYQ